LAVQYTGSDKVSSLFEAPENCSECHAQEYRDWLTSSHANASLNEEFQQVYAENDQPGYCLRCHASGYDPSEESYQYDGVICGNCHSISEGAEHPPAPINIARDPAICGTCHSGGHASVYEEWLASEHEDAGVDCVDCHTAHTNTLLLDDVNSTCGDCHANALDDEVHMGENMICTDCHMTPRQSVDDPTLLTLTGHSMAIDPGVCADCHGSTHQLTATGNDYENSETIVVLENEIKHLEELSDENLSAGLLGGAIGVLILLGLIYLVLRLGRVS